MVYSSHCVLGFIACVSVEGPDWIRFVLIP